ncbi:response regulator [Olivibacter domesticus]|uniref:response regulator n=1 Tax=Olivibacter domesticus TaxID=407022 RepID=UPI00138FEAB4|nr:response regulator [Olivibacter domesticus]
MENCAENRWLLCTLLKRLGMEVSTATIGWEGLEKAKSFHYDVIFVESSLGDMLGIELIEQLKREDGIHKVPIVFLASVLPADLVARALDAGASITFSKPVTEEKIQAIHSQLLAQLAA